MGRNINEIDNTNIVINGKKINYSVLLRFCLPIFRPMPFASNLIVMPKLRRFLMIGQRSNLCQRHNPRTSFNSNKGWLPYHIRLSHKSTGRFPTINQPHYQQWTDHSNRHAVQKLAPGTTK